MNHSDDDKLKAFLQTNAAAAPERKPDELTRLMRKLDLEDQPVVYQKKVWFAFAGAVAASFAAFYISIQTPESPFVAAVIENEESAIGFYDEDEELPSLEVGEDYVGLATIADL